MLKEKERIIVHPVLGAIRINEKFEQVLAMSAFQELAHKSQLGTNSLSPKNLSAKHSRLMHSIGVMHLTAQLLDVCEKKFSAYFTISERERETLELAALGHDVGHVAFSHSLEDRNMKTHERRTIEFFEEQADHLQSIFGYDIAKDVIQIYENNISVKRSGTEFQVKDELDILFIFTNLLIGTIDCDRMEYLMTDSFMVSGKRLDFREIFQYITIVLLNDSPKVGFTKEAVPIIEELLLTRYDQYQYVYYDAEAVLVELALNMYKEEKNWTEEELVAKSEYGVLTELSQILQREEDTREHRVAQIILQGNRENILFKKFEQNEAYDSFLEKLYAVTSHTEAIRTSQKKVTIYNPHKNRVYIKDDDGMVKDITEVSQKIKNYSVQLSYVMMDLELAKGITEKEAQNIRNLFDRNPIEIEKKFVFPQKELDVAEILNLLPGVVVAPLENWKQVRNEDQYYSVDAHQKIAMRHRRVQGKEDSYYLKLPTDDGTSITKREEHKFPNCTWEKFIELVTSILAKKQISFDAHNIVEGVKIITNRTKTCIQVQESMIEISVDHSTYAYEGNEASGKMLECELKKGDDLSLWYLTNHLKQYGFVETNESKETRAKKALGITK